MKTDFLFPKLLQIVLPTTYSTTAVNIGTIFIICDRERNLNMKLLYFLSFFYGVGVIKIAVTKFYYV